MFVTELYCVPLRDTDKDWHTYEKGGMQSQFQRRCILPSCKSKPRTFCLGGTRNVDGIVFVRKPSPTKRCWEILHQLRTPDNVIPLDNDGNAFQLITEKRRGNSRYGVEKSQKGYENCWLSTLITIRQKHELRILKPTFF